MATGGSTCGSPRTVDILGAPALGDLPLAIAGGIIPENVRDYLPISDCYLVATGIEGA